eukprot:Clim_evm8s221 gene=Clim_evmTU8s221
MRTLRVRENLYQDHHSPFWQLDKDLWKVLVLHVTCGVNMMRYLYTVAILMCLAHIQWAVSVSRVEDTCENANDADGGVSVNLPNSHSTRIFGGEPLSANHGIFIHISDAHLDNLYRKGSRKSKECHHGDGSAAKWGEHKCDAPPYLVEGVIKSMAEQFPDPDFMILTGDNARHDNDQKVPRGSKEIAHNIDQVAEIIHNHYRHGVPVLPSIGNNDIFPHNQILPQHDKMLPRMAKAWSRFLTQKELKFFEKHGYYSSKVASHLVVVALNTSFVHSANGEVHNCNHKASAGHKMFKFLTRELDAAEANEMKVVISGHVPPGEGHWKRHCERQFAKIVADYPKQIAGLLFGHHHSDSFHFIKKDGKEVGVVNVAPGIIPTYNPSFRVFKYDRMTGEILDYEQHYQDLDNINHDDEVKLTQEYRMKEAYKMKGLTLADYVKLSHDLKKDKKLEKLYQSYHFVGSRG